MQDKEIREKLILACGLRTDGHVARYVADQIANGAAEIPVIGGDARTGVPVQIVLNPAVLLNQAFQPRLS